MSIIEIIAVVFSLLSVVLTVKNNILCWPVGIVGIVFYMILFAQNQIWGNMALQILFVVQSIVGWCNWNEKSKYPIKWISKESRWNLLAVSVLLFILFFMIIRNHGGKMPYFDGVTTTLSVMAMVLLSYRKIDTWIFWIITDVIFIWFFYINSLYLSSAVYLVFLVLAISGFLQWRKSIKAV